jgi:hypothetical protein
MDDSLAMDWYLQAMNQKLSYFIAEDGHSKKLKPYVLSNFSAIFIFKEFEYQLRSCSLLIATPLLFLP